MAARRTRGWRLSTFMLLAPWLLTWVAFFAFPIFWSLYISFTPFSLLNPRFEWIGLSNYIFLIQSPYFWRTLSNTVVFTLGVVPTTLCLSLAAALMVRGPVPARGFIQASFFLPGVVSVVVMAIIFKHIFAPNGLMDGLLWLAGFTLPSPPWLLNPRWAIIAVMVMSVWTSFGFYMLLFVAALRSIPEDLYDAAAIDGASPWATFWHVDLPQLRPTILLVLALTTIHSLQVFSEIFVMTEGGPLGTTTTSVYYLYTLAFEDFHMGKASALSYMMFVIIMAVVSVQMWLLRLNRGTNE